MATSEPIRNKTDLNRLSDYFFRKRQYRNYVMIVLGSCTALRISDLLKLRWEDVYDFKVGRFRSHVMLTEKKTGKYKKIALCKDAIAALQFYFPLRQGKYIFSKKIVKASNACLLLAMRAKSISYWPNPSPASHVTQSYC